jgi:GNAT superfamily N-acetyltransferase
MRSASRWCVSKLARCAPDVDAAQQDRRRRRAGSGASHAHRLVPPGVVAEPGAAEVACGVIDEYQGHGIGGTLIRILSSIARQAGLNKLIAEVLASNRAMLKVFERSGLQVSTRRDGSVFHLTLTYD